MKLRYVIVDLDEQRLASRERMDYTTTLKRAKQMNEKAGTRRYIAVMLRPVFNLEGVQAC